MRTMPIKRFFSMGFSLWMILAFSIPEAFSADAIRNTPIRMGQLAVEQNTGVDTLSDHVSLPEDFLEALEVYGISKGEILEAERKVATAPGIYDLLLTSGERRVIKKERYDQSVIASTIALSRFYRSRGLPYLEFLQTKSSSYLTIVNGSVFTLQKRVPGERIDWGWASNDTLVQMAELLATMHREGREYEGQAPFDLSTDPNFRKKDEFPLIIEELVGLYEEAEKEATEGSGQHDWLKGEGKQELLRISLEAKPRMERAVAFIQENLGSDIYQSFPNSFLTHGDFVNWNVFTKDERPSGVIDLERSKKDQARWQDLLTPLYHLPNDEKGLPLHFDRFALWLTAYNRILQLEETERQPEVLRALLLMDYTHKIHMGLRHRQTWTLPSFMLENLAAIDYILEIPSEQFTLLSEYLKDQRLWDKRVLEPENIIPVEGPLDGLTILSWSHVYDTTGGIEMYLQNLNQALLERNEVTIIQMYFTPHTDPDSLEIKPPIQVGKGKIQLVPVRRYVGENFREIGELNMEEALYNLREFIQGQQIDLVTAHGLFRRDLPFARTLRGEFPEIPFFLQHHYHSESFDVPQKREQAELADGLGVITQNGLEEKFLRKSRLLPPSVDLEFFDPDRFEPSDEDFGVPDDVPLVLLPARIHPSKNQKAIIEIANYFKRSGIKVHFVLVGPTSDPDLGDTYYRELQGLIAANQLEDYISIIGGRSQEQIARLYLRSQFTILTSKDEGFGKVLIESQAMGRPVIAYDVGGIPDTMEDGVTGFLIPNGDTLTFAKRIHELLKDPEKLRQMQEAGRRSVQKFDNAQLAAKSEAFYLEIIAKKANAFKLAVLRSA